MMASCYGHREVVQAMLANGAEINIRNNRGSAALKRRRMGTRPISAPCCWRLAGHFEPDFSDKSRPADWPGFQACVSGDYS